jgi:hypothetical protein
VVQEGEGVDFFVVVDVDFVVVVADLEDAVVVVASLVGVAYQEVVEAYQGDQMERQVAFLAGAAYQEVVVASPVDVAYQEAVVASQEDVASLVEVGAFQDGQMENLYDMEERRGKRKKERKRG